MHKRTRQFILETLLTTRELSALIGVPEITLKKRYERDNRLAVLKGNNLLWDRRDFEKNSKLRTAKRRKYRPVKAPMCNVSGY